jgi:hypothetical protein
MDLIDLVQDRDQWRALVNTVMNAMKVVCDTAIKKLKYMHGMTGWDNARKYETAYCA